MTQVFANNNPAPLETKFDFMGMCIREAIQRLGCKGRLKTVYCAPDVYTNLMIELGPSLLVKEEPKECSNCGAPYEHTDECKYCGFELFVALRMCVAGTFVKILPDFELPYARGVAKFKTHDAAVVFYNG